MITKCGKSCRFLVEQFGSMDSLEVSGLLEGLRLEQQHRSHLPGAGKQDVQGGQGAQAPLTGN